MTKNNVDILFEKTYKTNKDDFENHLHTLNDDILFKLKIKYEEEQFYHYVHSLKEVSDTYSPEMKHWCEVEHTLKSHIKWIDEFLNTRFKSLVNIKKYYDKKFIWHSWLNGWSQKELAKINRVSVSTISKIINYFKIVTINQQYKCLDVDLLNLLPKRPMWRFWSNGSHEEIKPRKMEVLLIEGYMVYADHHEPVLKHIGYFRTADEYIRICKDANIYDKQHSVTIRMK